MPRMVLPSLRSPLSAGVLGALLSVLTSGPPAASAVRRRLRRLGEAA